MPLGARSLGEHPEPGPDAPPLRLEDLDFPLPAELIAQHPPPRRDTCNLLRLQRPSGERSIHRFTDLPDLLRSGDVLVRNVSRVRPARLQARRADTGGRSELLRVEPEKPARWWVLARPARALSAGMCLHLADGTELTVVGTGAGGRRLLEFPAGIRPLDVARRLGSMPLPPYIRRPVEPADAEAYQTVYARVDGSVAAPTAGLHFTPELLGTLAARDIHCVDVVLHIGPGTFAPVRHADPLQHRMDAERFEVARQALAACDAARRQGGRIVAVGTTAARLLESVALWERGAGSGRVELQAAGDTLHGRTRLFVYPPYAFRRVDVLLTNFHLPRSTLLLLVDAFAGREAVRAAYAEAVARRFRFFSYGDAMLIE